MRILIHAVAAHDMGGAGRHLMGFLPALERVGQGDEYVLYVNERLTIGPLPSNFHIHRLPVQSAWQRLWWDQVTLPRLALEAQADVVLGLLSFGSARPSRPQIVFLRHPIHCPYYTMGLGVKGRLDVALRRYFLYLTLRASRLIVAPSAAICDTVRQVHPDLPAERFYVLPHAFDRELFLTSGDLPQRVSALLPEERTDDAVRLLYVGHILPYKDFDTMLAAVRLLADQGLNFKLHLTIARENWPVGFDRWRAEVSRLCLDDYIVVLGRVPANAAPELYRRCDVLWFPSLCETFGWPLIEAMALGLPILASDTTLNREMAGEAAVYYPPFDAGRAAEAAVYLIESPAARHRLGEIGQRQADAHIRWDEYVETVLNYCAEAIAGANDQGRLGV